VISVRRVLMRARLRNRCQIGRDSLVYEVGRIVPTGGGRESIAIGDHTHVRGELLTFPKGRIRIGNYCYVGEQTRIWAGDSISIGDRVLIAHLTTILDNATHPLDAAERHRHYRSILESGHPPDARFSPQPVRIDDDAWIGCSVVILPGVTVGRGAIVGAGSVVTSDVPPFSLVAGNPARVVRDLRVGGESPER
jgi:acetyltransferase-like isoleucine patch superfamily enzyme